MPDLDGNFSLELLAGIVLAHKAGSHVVLMPGCRECCKILDKQGFTKKRRPR